MRQILTIFFLLFLVYFSGSRQALAQRLDICFKQNCFNVTVAETEAERTRGLMFRTKLDCQQGMLFVFGSQDIYGFWMKNTLIPLDIIWIDKDKRVVFIKRSAQPCREEECPVIYPEAEAVYVLELNAGVSNDIGLEVGDSLEFNLP